MKPYSWTNGMILDTFSQQLKLGETMAAKKKATKKKKVNKLHKSRIAKKIKKTKSHNKRLNK